MNDPISQIDKFIEDYSQRAFGGLNHLDVWDVINALLEIRHSISNFELVIDGDEMSKYFKGKKNVN
jgi:hypothetical protein